MKVEMTPLEGALLIKPQIWKDKRGYFIETWQQKRYTEVGINLSFVQDNHSCSIYRTLRGLHFQRTRPQGKLVSVSLGSIFDVIVDIRKSSATFGKWFGIELTQDNHWQLWIPPGFAHGFVVTSDVALFHYIVTDFYHQEDEGSIRWNDPYLDISWPIANPILSKKDAEAPFWTGFITF